MEDKEVELSKTKRKQNMESLQKLGVELVKLSKEKLDKIELPNSLKDAILLAQKLTANGAIRRQNQYIGRLMRDVDPEYIQAKLGEFNSDSVANTKLLHKSEVWREALLKDDKELNTFVSRYGQQDVNELKNLIRATRKEQTIGLVKNYRKLFKFIRDIIEKESQRT